MQHKRTKAGGFVPRAKQGSVPRRWLGVVLLLGVTGCDGLLTVDIPGRVPADALNDPALATTLITGAMADFECGWSEFVLAESLFTDEFISASTIVTVTTMDARTAQVQTFGATGCTTDRNRRAVSPYRPLQTARVQAEDVYRRLNSPEWSTVANREANMARMAANAGYMYTVLGEAYCEKAVAIDGGPLRTKQELWKEAESWFTKAIGHATTAGAASQPVRLMATLGRARVRLNLGDGPNAVVDARAIPDGFVFNVVRDATVPSRDNQIFQQSGFNPHHSVGPNFRGLTVDGVPDPRVNVVDGNRLGEDGFTRMWFQRKYTNLNDPLPLATWREALLIIAEVEGGQVAVDIINKLRDRHNLPRFASTDPAAIRAQVIEEKRRETFAEGHRINEMQRHGLPWPTGLTHKGLTFGSFTCLPLMLSESENNPNAR